MTRKLSPLRLAGWLIPLLLPLAAQADNPACPQGPLAVAYYDFGVAYHQGKGYDVDLVRELARRLGCPIRAEADYPRIRALKQLELGLADIGSSTLITPERQRYLWLYPYNHSKNMVLLPRASRADSLDDLLKSPSLRWGAIRGYRHSPAQDRLLNDLAQQHKLVIAESEDDLYQHAGQRFGGRRSRAPHQLRSMVSRPPRRATGQCARLLPRRRNHRRLHRAEQGAVHAGRRRALAPGAA
ncbi:transporter substrate-binding domain-containing protein [Chromobacterium vaccinii]|uniref:Transporter substrate-binding domain-containing protein n=1 Tax=Chromobacterium vaccinii TaxID=1108595 RepID=A0ABV0FIW0_9NEIS